MPDLTLRELSDLLNVKESTLRWRVKRGLVPGAYRFGNRWRIRAEAVGEIRSAPARKPDAPAAEPMTEEGLDTQPKESEK